MTCYFSSYFFGQSKLQHPASPQQARECNSLLCPKAQDPEVLVQSVDIYQERGLLILKMRNLRISDINNFGKTTVFLEWWYWNVRLLNLYSLRRMTLPHIHSLSYLH